ncbi:hypothetical protein KP509_16G067700 [Ceratopteris richardii]|uniref:SOSEKI DIX-like domain-containing protein n=1 Tax=Ceratopteris richardii TaxID=49495 RepID=A0A8T2T458_CERRI|nr:hypothetical protein KP509_16G067700 [Ceratopteris richardii]
MDRTPPCSIQNSSYQANRAAASKKAQVVYYLSYRGGLLEQPHLLEVTVPASRELCLKDVKARLANLRGLTMACSFSWSYKRNYKESFVWQDLESDTDPILPTYYGSEYVIKGCRIESPPDVPASSFRMVSNLRQSTCSTPNPQEESLRTAQILKSTNLSDMCELSKDNRDGSPYDGAKLHDFEGRVGFNLGVIEGLESLRLSQGIDLHYDYAESQASASLTAHHQNAMEGVKKAAKNCKANKECCVFKHYKKDPILDAEQYGSPVFSVLKKLGGDSSYLNYHLGADAATQTCEDDDCCCGDTGHKNQTSLCFSDLPHRQRVSSTSVGEASSLDCEVSLHSAMLDLCREEILQPLYSTSSSTCTSTHSASSSSITSSSVDAHQNCITGKPCCSAEDQKLEKLLTSTPRVQLGKEALLNDEDTSAAYFAANGNDQGHNTCGMSAGFKGTSMQTTEFAKGIKPNFSSPTVKSQVMGLSSNSSKFLHLISCGRGLEIINPSDSHIQRSSSMNSICHTDSAPVLGTQSASLLINKHNGFSCLDVFSPDRNAQNERISMNAESWLPIAGSDALMSLNSDEAGSLRANLVEDCNDNIKRPWHWRGLFHFYSRNRNVKPKNISLNSAANAADVFKYSVGSENLATGSSTGGYKVEGSSHEHGLTRSKSARCPTSLHQHFYQVDRVQLW